MSLPSHLDFDTVANMLEPICDEHIAIIHHILEHPMGAAYDDLGFTEVFLRIEFLLALHERGWPVKFPDLQRLLTTYPAFIRKWTEYHHSAAHIPAPQDQEQSIRACFETLVKASRETAQ